MNVVTDTRIDEAIRRMEKLELHKNVIKEFKKERKLNKSQMGRVGNVNVGVLYWLDEDERQKVKELEEEYDMVVYHVIESHTSFGTLLSMLYVSSNEEEWVYDEDLMNNDCVFAYVLNLDDDTCSEFGTIGIKKAYGGLVRTA